MYSPGLRHPMFRSLLALAVVAAFEACGDGDGPLEPAADRAAEPVTDALPAITTSPWIAFMSYAGAPNVYKVSPQGGQWAGVFTQTDGVRSPAWSWDNQRVAMVRSRWNSNHVPHDDIWIVNADGSNGHWARNQPSVWHLNDPSWSPNGARIVMTVNVGGVRTLGWIEPATSKVGLFYAPLGGAIHGTRPSYNKAGTKILYVGEHTTTVEQINTDGSGRKVHITGTARLDYPSFSPDGGRIAYEKGPVEGNTDIFVRNIATAATTRLTWSTAADRHPSWSPDGTRLAFASARTGKYQIYTMKAGTGGDLLRITYADQWLDSPVWTH
jgi:Tol biopolymer transport system component/predicted small lipoprotein YifL